MSKQEKRAKKATENPPPEPKVKEPKPKKKKEPTALTANQLFSAYTRALEKVRGMATTLAEETAKVEQLREELAGRFHIYVSGQPPADKTSPIIEPYAGSGDTGSATAPETARVEGGEYKPPAQHHTDAPHLASTGEVDEIRRDSGLNVEAGDSEALATEGLGMMEHLQGSMKGEATVVPHPGEHQEGGNPVTPPSNEGGGPVTQKALSEGE